MEYLQRLFYTALGAASVFYLIVKISLSHWKNRGILHKKPKFFWGNLKGVGHKRHVASALQEVYEEYKNKAPFVGFYAILKPMVVVLDLEVISHILGSDSEYFIERGLYYNPADDPLSANLLQLDGEKYQEIHKKSKRVYSEESTKTVFPALLHVAESYQRSLSQQYDSLGTVNINELVECFNVDVLSTLVFGLEGNSLVYAHTEFRAFTRKYWENFKLWKAYLAINYPNLARLLQYKTYEHESTVYFLSLIEDQMNEREWNRAERRNDFLKIFTELKRKRRSDERLNSREIAAQCFSFILVGLEAYNSTLSFCLYELALQTEVQSKARQEIETVLQHHNNQITLEALDEMIYLKQILCETLRKHTPYPFLLRNTVKDYEVPDSVFMLCENNAAIIPVHAIHHDARIYPEPQRFDPDRFTSEERKKRHPMSWLPFGVGARSCIAKQFAELQMLVGLVTLLRCYEFSPCAATPIPVQYDNSKLILKPQSDIKLLMQRI